MRTTLSRLPTGVGMGLGTVQDTRGRLEVSAPEKAVEGISCAAYGWLTGLCVLRSELQPGRGRHPGPDDAPHGVVVHVCCDQLQNYEGSTEAMIAAFEGSQYLVAG